MAKPIPDGYHSLTPYLIVDGATKALDFYKRAFGAEELFRMPAPGGRVGHAEMRIGDSIFMLADESPDHGARAPQGSSPVHLMIYCEDVDKVFKRSLAAGGKELRPLQNQFYGDRSGTLADPFGHQWTVATHVEDVPPEEMQRRMAQQK
jgi:PhnB protein